MNSKLLICISALLLSINAFGQRDNNSVNQYDTKDQANNEVRLNLLTTMLGFPEINYERYIADNMGVGLALGMTVDKSEIISMQSMVLPYYRIYFGQKRASGFFIEGNMAVVRIKEKKYKYAYDSNTGYYYDDGDYYTSSTNFGCGVAAGFKLLTKSGITGEIFLGGGRLFGNADQGGYPRVGLCIGKRF